MRVVGGPLLCIGDLLRDLGEEEANDVAAHDHRQSSSIPSYEDVCQSSFDLTELFQLCSALETANRLVQSTNANDSLLSETVGELEGILKRGDLAESAAKAAHLSLNQSE